MMGLTRGGFELLERVRPMWDELNAGNVMISPDFSERYRSWSFEERMATVQEKAFSGHVLIIIVTLEGKDIGYLVGTIDSGGTAELDSLFVSESHRDEGIGGTLVEELLSWTRAFPVRRTILSVTWGNEDSPRLYERHGFRRRATLYEIPPH